MSHHRQPAGRNKRLRFEPLERRLCLAAELGFVLTSGESGTDVFDDVEVDNTGNIYVSSNDQLLKYSPARALLWAVNLNDAWELDLDGAGNVYAMGPLGTVDVPGVTGNVVLNGQGQTDVYVVKFNPAGLAVWGQALGNAAAQQPGAMAVDGVGNVVVTGNFADSLTLGSDTLISAGNNDTFVARLSTSGTVEWARRIGSTSHDSAAGAGMDAAGNAYVTGNYSEAITLPGVNGDIVLPKLTTSNTFTVKLTPTGEFAWGVGIGGATSQSLAVDIAGGGAVVVSGEYGGSVDFDPGPADFQLAGNNDYFLLKLDLAGQFVWARAFVGSTAGQPMDLAIGSQGQIHYAGIFYGTMNLAPHAVVIFSPLNGVTPWWRRSPRVAIWWQPGSGAPRMSMWRSA